jgi:cyclic-di-AMP phosphodiesterase
MRKSNLFIVGTTIVLIVSLLGGIYTFVTPDVHPIITNLFVFFFAASAMGIVVTVFGNRSFKKMKWLERRLDLWNSISYRVKRAGEISFNELPIGIVVFDINKTVEWANNYAKEIFLSPLIERNIEVIHKELYYKMHEEQFEIQLYGRIFECKMIREQRILYLMDRTKSKLLEKKYADRTVSLGIISLDNLDNALTNFDAQERAYQISNLIGILSDWSNKHNIYLKGFSEAQYLMIMTQEQLYSLMADNFKVLDEIKEYSSKESLRVSASIGIASKDMDFNDLSNLVDSQLMMAQNRGGNQAVVRIGDEVKYFGGKTHSFENRSPVYVRAKMEDLRDLILSSNQVFIMPHIDTDADAFGASVALFNLARAFKKTAKIVFDEAKVDQTVTEIYQSIEKEYISMLPNLIHPNDAHHQFEANDLLILVDSQYQHLLMDERLYKKAKKVAIIDHHRRSSAAISTYHYLYTQTASSSSVELVVEMFEFVDGVEVTSTEATWMLMGIIVDTNNLMFRTSYRTFNVISRLQKYGAEMYKAQKYLREDREVQLKRIEMMQKIEVIDEAYGIVVSPEEVNSKQFLAKIADHIIGMSRMKAGFAIGHIAKGEIGISARSLDEVNVQLIMEYFGGGGHYNNAACQIKGESIENVKNKLIEKLNELAEGAH